MKLRIIDCLSPFFIYDDRDIINWSKIPFPTLEKNGMLDTKKVTHVLEACDAYLQKVSSLGYNSITLDDLAHFVSLPIYSAQTKDKLAGYKTLYRAILSQAKKYKIRVYVLTDVMFYSPEIKAYMKKHKKDENDILNTCIVELFKQYPTVKGLILRFGETDAKDVDDYFVSKQHIKTPRQLSKLISKLLPIVEQKGAHLICRTWSLGAYPIGDIMWNKKTFDKAFGSITSPQFIISMKYGNTDFFRNVPVNDLFSTTRHKTIVELQARREYEGFGEFPSYVGFSYQEYLEKIREHSKLVGILVWAQTGGWGPFRRLTYVRDSSIWVELNVFAIIQIVMRRSSASQSIKDFYHMYSLRSTKRQVDTFYELIVLSEKVIDTGYYYKDFSDSNLFIRRTRIPPLLIPWWDKVYINSVSRTWIEIHIKDTKDFVSSSFSAVQTISKMKQLAKEIKLSDTLSFYYDTFELLHLSRTLQTQDYSSDTESLFHSRLAHYKEIYLYRYDFKYVAGSNDTHKKLMHILMKLFVRRDKRYRKRDKAFLATGTTLFILAIIKFLKRGTLKKIAKQLPQSIESFFR